MAIKKQRDPNDHPTDGVRPSSRPLTDASQRPQNGKIGISPSEVAPVEPNSVSMRLSAADRFLTIANHLSDESQALAEFVEAIKEICGCQSVGIRIYDDEKCLSFGAHAGFTEDFLASEGHLSLEKHQCLCTRVFLQQVDNSLQFFSKGGSFYTNHSDQLLNDPAISKLAPLRGTCFEAGYQSMGLFPIRSMKKVLGLVHVADTRRDQLPPDLVQVLENAALQVGVAIEKARALAALEKTNKILESRLNERTTDLEKTFGELDHQIEQRLVVENDLEQNQQLLQRVFESISDPLVLMDEKSHVKMVNRAAMDYYGAARAEKAIHQLCFEGLGQYRHPCQSCRIPAAVKDGRQMEFERDGFVDPKRTEVVELFPIKDASETPRGAVMRIHDVTEAKDMQQQVNQLENQASIGLLVSSVAHEIKNPNSFIAFNISVLRTYFKDLLPILDEHAANAPEFEVAHMRYAEFRTDVFKLMDTIEHGSKRIDSILGNLKTLSPVKTEVKCLPLSLPDVINRVIDTVGRKIEKTVKRFDVHIHPRLPEIYSDPEILEQVILNLLVNATQAADKGDAYISLKAEPQDKDDQWVMLVVEDNGHGMSPQTQRRIFEPFYSTKIAEGGTGLGLYVCRNLLNEIGGQLYLHSELGKGTRFTVELPVNLSACVDAVKLTRSRGSDIPLSLPTDESE